MGHRMEDSMKCVTLLAVMVSSWLVMAADVPVPQGEPTNAEEAAAQKEAVDRNVDEQYRAIMAKLPPDQQAWEKVLQEQLGGFYLPLHKRDKIAGRSNAWDFVTDDPKLPRVLLIGDSVSCSYTVSARKTLAGKANVHRAPANCGSTLWGGIKNIDVWLGDGQWDVIYFNFGIHDCRTPIADYTQRLEQLVGRMKKTGAKLIWAATTPIPDIPSKKMTAASIVERNQAAAEIMKKQGVAVDDLFAFITPHLSAVGKPNDVHFRAEGNAMLGKRAAESIEAVLLGTGVTGGSESGLKPAAGASLKVDINWPAYMAQHDMLWDVVPPEYYSAPFVGNGIMGTILFRDDVETNSLCFEIGRTDIYEPCRLPIGRLLMTPVGTMTGADLRLDLWNAEVHGEIRTDAGLIQLRCFTPYNENVIVVEIKTAGKEGNCRFSFRPEEARNPRRILAEKNKAIAVRGHEELNPPFELRKERGVDVCVQRLLTGGDYTTAWKDVKKGPDTRVIYVHVANGIPAGNSAAKAVTALEQAEALGIPEMERAHRAWWHAFYPASFISIPDTRTESFCWIQWYKLASAMREDGPAVDLMGPWFRLTPWPCYWMNLNIQLSHYTVQIGNHLELGEPLCRWLENSMEDLINNAPPEYRNDSAYLGNPTNLRLISAMQNKPPYQFLALPWLAQIHYLQARYAGDDSRLKDKVYPLMRRAFNLYLHYIKMGDDGKYHLPLSFSDEYGNDEDINMNIAVLRWGLRTLVECNERLKLNDPMLSKWKETLEKLVEYQVDENGLMIGKNTPFAMSHRHYSHLFAIFPFYELNIDEHPDKRTMMEKSVLHFISLKSGPTMYKLSGSSSLSAALGNAEDALKQLDRALTIIPKGTGVRENTLYAENGSPTFESPISAARSVMDMLLQSREGVIRVFPACPSKWQDVVFHDLRAEGAFLVSAERKGRKTRWVRIKSLSGEPCRLKVDGQVMDLKLKKGGEIILGEGDYVVSPLPVQPGQANAWGVHK